MTERGETEAEISGKLRYNAKSAADFPAVGDRKAMEAGGGKYLNFIKIVLRKK